MSQGAFAEAWLAGVDGHQFYTRTYAATFPKAVVLFVHGFAEHVARYEHVHVQYPARNVTVFTFDQRGFGRTALDGAHRSKDSAYGKTNWPAQLQDIDFFAKYLAKEYPGTPLFLMGHSMGGGLVLAYFTRSAPPPSPEGVKLFTGVVCSSPWITLTQTKPRVVRWVGAKIASLLPNATFPADVGVEHLTRNEAKREENLKDPLIMRKGTLRSLDNMLAGGEKLLSEDYKRWPNTLPILFIHGTADKVTNYKSTEAFYNKIEASDKKLSLYEGGYHELVNEIDDIPERFTEECIAWIENHVPTKPEVPASKL